MTLYADDPDVHVRYQLTDSADGGLNDFPAVVQVDGSDVPATWEGDPAATRVIRVPLAGLTAGAHRLRLVVPGGNDVTLGTEYLY